MSIIKSDDLGQAITGRERIVRRQHMVSGVLVMIIALLLVVGLTSPAARPAAAQEGLVVWYTVDNIGPVMDQVSTEFEEEFGVLVDVQFVRPQQLFDAMSKASGGGPDVILSSSDDIGPLVDNDLVMTGRLDSSFFLADVLDALPDLMDDACPETDIASCLWPRVSPTLTISPPDASQISRTESWLCRSADWMPMCSDGNLPGQPLSWWFNIYLISDKWLAENGLLVPVDVSGIDELRTEYGLNYERVKEGSLPSGESADDTTVYIFPSTLLIDDPQGMMRSLGSFETAGYLPVLEIGIDSLFISATSSDPALAQEYIEFVAAHPDAKLDMMAEAKVLPALDATAMRAFGLDSPGTRAVLRAVITLSAYTQLVY
jgi:hypothetical protein